MNLVNGVLQGNKRYIARLITLIEEESPLAVKALKEIYPHTGKATILGITGPPGAGKSSLVGAIARHLRKDQNKVGIIAIDPTSPFTGGALLGDRVRMQDLATDDGVFIRSMGSRGALGGLSRATFDAAKVLDAGGMDYIIIETVGVGQSEVDIMKLADIVALVLMPGMGDEVQAIKAGIMEIADIYVINKADKDGVEKLLVEIDMALDLNPNHEFRPPVVKTIASTGDGIDEFIRAFNNVFSILKDTARLREKRIKRTIEELLDIVKQKILVTVFSKLSQEVDELVHLILKGKIDPYSAAEIIVDKTIELKF